MDRRQFLQRTGTWGAAALGAGLLGGTLDACSSGSSSSSTKSGGSSSAPYKLNYQLGWIPNAEFAGTYIALEKGYFKSAGVDTSILPGGPTTAPIAIIEAGKALVTIADPVVTATGVKQGADVRIIGAQYQRSPYAITSLAKNPIPNPHAMIGRKIGLAASDQSNWQAFLKLNHISASQVPTVPIQFDPSVLVTGECDGIVAFSYEQSSELAQKGVQTTSFLFDDYGFKIMWNTYIVTAASVNNPTTRKALVGFLTGEARGWTDQVKNPSEGAALAVNKYGANLKLNLDEQTREAQGARDLIVTSVSQSNGLFSMQPDLIAETRSVLKLLDLDLSASVFDTSLLDEVHAADPSLAKLSA